MSENSSQQAAPDEGAALPRFPSEVDGALEDLRALREQLNRGVRSEQDRLDVMVDLCEAFDELDQAMTLGADLPAAWREARMIRTVEQLNALPGNAIVRDAEGHVLERHRVVLPALLLWHPDWAPS